MSDVSSRVDERREAGAMAIGLLTTLLGHNELPKYARRIAREILQKWDGAKSEKRTEAEQSEIRG